MHEVMQHEPMHYRPEPEHEGGDGGYSSNHVSHSSSSHGGEHRGRGMDPHDEKKAAASSTSAMIGQLQKLGLVDSRSGPMTPMLQRGQTIQPRILAGASVTHETKKLPPPSSPPADAPAANISKQTDKQKDQPK